MTSWISSGSLRIRGILPRVHRMSTSPIRHLNPAVRPSLVHPAKAYTRGYYRVTSLFALTHCDKSYALLDEHFQFSVSALTGPNNEDGEGNNEDSLGKILTEPGDMVQTYENKCGFANQNGVPNPRPYELKSRFPLWVPPGTTRSWARSSEWSDLPRY
jgi:hypothetical protein